MDEMKFPPHPDKRISRTILLLLPSLLALAVSITALLYNLGNRFFDLKNTCYRVYIDTLLDKQKTLNTIKEVLASEGITKYAIDTDDLIHDAFKNDKRYFTSSYHILLRNIPRKEVHKSAKKLREAFGLDMIFVEETVIVAKYVGEDEIFDSYEDFAESKE